MPKTLSQAERDKQRLDKQQSEAARKKEERALRDEQLRAAHSAMTSAPPPAATKPAPRAFVARASPAAASAAYVVTGMMQFEARLRKKYTKVEIKAGEPSEAAAYKATEAATVLDSSSSGAVSAAYLVVLNDHRAQITFVDATRCQQLDVSLPASLKCNTEALRAAMREAVQPETSSAAAGSGKQAEEHKEPDHYEARRRQDEQDRKAAMKEESEVRADAKKAARHEEEKKHQARKVKTKGLSKAESLAHGERNAKIVSGEDRTKNTKM